MAPYREERGRKTMTLKRIGAIALLVLFLLLLANIYFGWIAWQMSVGIYVVLIVVYFFTAQAFRPKEPKE
jgi:fatty acid desaturase